MLVEFLGYIWLIVTVGGADPSKLQAFKLVSSDKESPSSGTPWIHIKFLFGASIVIFGLPFIFAPNQSLLSKLLPKHVQGMRIYYTLYLLYVAQKFNIRFWSGTATVHCFIGSYSGPLVGWCFTTFVLPSHGGSPWDSYWTTGE